MTHIELGELSLKELKALQKDVEREITSFTEREKSKARAKVEALARELGYSFAELVDAPVKGKRVSSARYRHPENPSLTWSGMGRKPAWFNDWLAAGKSAEDLKIA
ncbi:H-NS family nucleoid-associated regulatory protein [Paracoccus sp. P2]|uniref:H-NS histone family protein n=1 Tax=Paracoccus sp. P2 TaxID=3248840 RepID=UPI00391F7B13